MQKLLLFFITVAVGMGACQTPSSPQLSSSRVHTIDSTLQSDQKIEAYIEPLRDSIQSIMSEVIGQTTSQLNVKKPGTALSNFVADLILEEAKNEIRKKGMKEYPTISVINIKGLRAPLPKGEILVKDIFALMPFENQMVVVKLSGNQIKQLYRHMGKSNGDGIAGGSFQFNSGEVTQSTIQGNPVKDEAFYYVATSDYLANGGDHYNIFTEASEKYESPKKIRDLIIEHIKNLTQQGKFIEPSSKQRITFE